MLTTKIIGDHYEYFILESVKDQYDEIWHWKQFPEHILYELGLIKDYNTFSKYRYDIGADLVAKKNGKYFFIQCKNYSGIICMQDLAGFYFLLYEYNLNGILYYNGTLSQRVKDLENGKIQIINYPFNNQIIHNQITHQQKIIPREYQLDAYNKMKDYNSCILSLPCGMGKTLTASLLAANYDNIIILSPLRCLAQQLLINMENYLGEKYNPILVSMDGHRNINDIKKFIKSKNIFSCTYDSADIIEQLLELLPNKFLIIDEFHNLTKNNISDLADPIYRIINNTTKQLYLSATPKKAIKHDYIYEYSWQEAIKNKYICDFDIIVHNNNELTDFWTIIENYFSADLNKKLVIRAYFILKSMLYYGNRKCICYMTCIDKAKIFGTILPSMATFLNIDVSIWQINYNTSKSNRSNYITEFTKSTNLCIMINVHILDEGIDIPDCDSVFITQPNKNIENIVQRMSRANRITPNKQKSMIYLWCGKNHANNVLSYISDNTNGVIDQKIIRVSLTDKKLIVYEKYQHKEQQKLIHPCNINLNEYLANSFANIPTDFVDMYTKYWNDYIKNPGEHNIPLNDIISYLEIKNIDRFLENIRKNYIFNVDYTKKYIKGKTNVYYYINFNTFTKLCMVSNAKKTKKIREYIITLGNFIKININ